MPSKTEYAAAAKANVDAARKHICSNPDQGVVFSVYAADQAAYFRAKAASVKSADASAKWNAIADVWAVA
jgi:hypothetical protein